MWAQGGEAKLVHARRFCGCPGESETTHLLPCLAPPEPSHDLSGGAQTCPVGAPEALALAASQRPRDNQLITTASECLAGHSTRGCDLQSLKPSGNGGRAADITSPFPNETVVHSVWDLAKVSAGTCSKFLWPRGHHNVLTSINKLALSTFSAFSPGPDVLGDPLEAETRS